MNQEEKFNNVEQLLEQAGYTLSDLMRDASKYNSSLLQMKDDDLAEYNRLYSEIDKDAFFVVTDAYEVFGGE